MIRFVSLIVCLGLATFAEGRTITLTDEDCEQMAVIAAEAPRLSWALHFDGRVWTTGSPVQLHAGRSMLIRYPLEVIPKGQRITFAEWVVPIHELSKPDKIHVRRIVGPWGPGVCHLHRMTQPEKREWAKPGATGGTADRAAKPTAILNVVEPGERAINVTEDVELWYTGAATNQGWILSVENVSGKFELVSPFSDKTKQRGKWKLRITYEPE